MPVLKKFQERLLNSFKKKDYFLLFIVALIPIIFSHLINIWNPVQVGCGQYTSFREAFNFHSHIIIIPLTLFLLRTISNLLFGLNIQNNFRQQIAILKLFQEEDARDKIYEDLRNTILNPRIPLIVLIIDIIHHCFDIGEVFYQYYLAFLGGEINIQDNCSINTNTSSFVLQKSYIYWANLFILKYSNDHTNPVIDITTNFLFTISAYLGQFILLYFAYMGIIVLLLHNIFYLRLIYQRKRVDVQNIKYYIVLNFEDPAAHFGLGKLNSVFNAQILILIIAGLFILVSRYSVITYRISFIDFLNPKKLLALKLSDLFPEFGQYVAAIAWLFGFFVVLLPSLVKFIPIFSGSSLTERLTIEKYLQEFLTPYDDEKYPLKTYEQVNLVAKRFARNSFWPIGDDSARWLFYFVFAVFFAILFPFKFHIILIFIIFLLGLFFGTIFLDFYKWILKHIDKRLVNGSSRGESNVTYNYGDTYQDISNSTIVNRSTVDKVTLNKIEEEIKKLGNTKAIDLFKNFTQELEKAQPEKTTLRKCWNEVVEVVPSITEIPDIITNISKYIN
jgi:hypothetical protein